MRHTDPSGHAIPCEPGDVCQHPDPDPLPPPPGPGPEDPDPDPGDPDPNPGGGHPLPIPDPTPDPECDPNLPGCDPIYSGTLSAQELLTLQTNLTNWQSILGNISTGMYVIAGGLAVATTIAALATPVSFPLVVGLATATAVFGIGGTIVGNEANQLGYLINEVNTMQSLATSSPENNVNVYVSTHPDYYGPLPNLTYDGANDVYVANSGVTFLVLSSFSNP